MLNTMAVSNYENGGKTNSLSEKDNISEVLTKELIQKRTNDCDETYLRIKEDNSKLFSRLFKPGATKLINKAETEKVLAVIKAESDELKLILDFRINVLQKNLDRGLMQMNANQQVIISELYMSEKLKLMKSLNSFDIIFHENYKEYKERISTIDDVDYVKFMMENLKQNLESFFQSKSNLIVQFEVVAQKIINHEL